MADAETRRGCCCCGGAAREFVHFGGAAYYQRRALVDVLGLDVEDAALAVGGDAAGLFGDEGDRIGFVEQPQLAGGMGFGGRVEEDAALEQRAVEVRDQRADVARAVFAAQRAAAQARRDSPDRPRGSCRRWPRSRNSICRCSGMRMFSWLSTKAPIFGIEREAVDAVAGGVDENRRRAVDDVAGGDLLASRAAGRRRASVLRRFSGRRKMEKMVPTLTLTSMFDEPSSGSKTTTYLPVSGARSKVTGSSFSSETRTATVSRVPRQCSSAWLA